MESEFRYHFERQTYKIKASPEDTAGTLSQIIAQMMTNVSHERHVHIYYNGQYVPKATKVLTDMPADAVFDVMVDEIEELYHPPLFAHRFSQVPHVPKAVRVPNRQPSPQSRSNPPPLSQTQKIDPKNFRLLQVAHEAPPHFSPRPVGPPPPKLYTARIQPPPLPPMLGSKIQLPPIPHMPPPKAPRK